MQTDTLDTVLIDKEMLMGVKPSNLHLSIEASDEGFGFALFDLLNNRYVGIGYRNFGSPLHDAALAKRLSEEFDKNHLHETGFTKSSLVWVSNRATLVPEALFDEKYANDYFNLNLSTHAHETLYYERVKGLGAYNVFTIPEALEDFCSAKLKNPAVMHHSRILLENLLLADNPKGRLVYLHVQAKHFDIVVIEDGALLLYNYYHYISAEDFTYHTLNTCKQLGIDPQTLEVTLLGEVEPDSTLFAILTKYLYKVTFYAPTPDYSLSLELGKLPHHFYYNLLNQYACV